MRKDLALEILRKLALGRELSNETCLGSTFGAMLDRSMVAFDGAEPCLMPAGRALLEEAEQAASKARVRRNAAARGRGEAMRSLGMRRVSGGGWE